MARRVSGRERLRRIKARGFTDAQIAAATGRGESFIQKVRTGADKKGVPDAMLPALARLDKLTRERTRPTAAPLPSVANLAPRRKQAVRTREVIATTGQTTSRVYIGTSRKDDKFYAYKTLRSRLERAARRGERVRLTTNWRIGQWMGRRGGKPREGQQYTLWDDGIHAQGALDELDAYGFQTDPAGALAALIAEYTTESDTYLRVEDFASYSLQIFEPSTGWDVDDPSEWA